MKVKLQNLSMIKMLMIKDDANLANILRTSLKDIVGAEEVNVTEICGEELPSINLICPDILMSDGGIQALPGELEACFKNFRISRSESKDCSKKKIYSIGKYQFDPENLLLIYDSVKKTLTKKEAQILELLLDNKGEIVKRNDILLKLWNRIDFPSSRSLDVFITKIRSYLKKDPSVKIRNVKGAGLFIDFD